MELSDFIREAIKQIAIGVGGARLDVAKLVSIAPPAAGGENVLLPSHIEFDIAVTTATNSSSSNSKSGKAGASIEVIGFKAGTDANLTRTRDQNEQSSTVSRIAFSVPVHFNMNARNDPLIESERSAFQKCVDELS